MHIQSPHKSSICFSIMVFAMVACCAHCDMRGESEAHKEGVVFEGMAGTYPEKLGDACTILKKVNDRLSNGMRSDHIEYTNLLLLHGEPGTGKSTVARKIAATAGVKCFEIHGPALVDKYVGSGVHAIQDAYDEVCSWIEENNCAAVFMIDELDGLTKNDESFSDQYIRAVKQLLIILDKIEENPHILFIATTNSIEKTDKALIDRLERVEVPLPSATVRRDFIKFHMSNRHKTLDQKLEDHLVKKTDGLSIRSVKSVLKNALMQAQARDKELSVVALDKFIGDVRAKLKNAASTQNRKSWLTWTYETTSIAAALTTLGATIGGGIAGLRSWLSSPAVTESVVQAAAQCAQVIESRCADTGQEALVWLAL